MSNLFTNPVAWSTSTVGTWLRFWLFSLFFVGLIWAALLFAPDSGLRSASWALGLFISAYQVMTHYALRRLVLLLQQSRPNAVET
jgi:hypothetical protein